MPDAINERTLEQRSKSAEHFFFAFLPLPVTLFVRRNFSLRIGCHHPPPPLKRDVLFERTPAEK